MPRTLNSVTKRLNTRYRAWKLAEKKKDVDRQVFFALASKEVSKQPLARKSVEVPEKFRDDIDLFVTRNYPGWRILGSGQLSKPDGSEFSQSVLIEEDPEYKEFSYVNEDLGLEFRRTVAQGQVTLDDEVLQEEDPELWEEITELRRVPKELDALTPEQLAKLAAYLIKAKPTVRLAAPKKPKEDE